jgi:hypothetical protein
MLNKSVSCSLVLLIFTNELVQLFPFLKERIIRWLLIMIHLCNISSQYLVLYRILSRIFMLIDHHYACHLISVLTNKWNTFICYFLIWIHLEIEWKNLKVKFEIMNLFWEIFLNKWSYICIYFPLIKVQLRNVNIIC